MNRWTLISLALLACDPSKASVGGDVGDTAGLTSGEDADGDGYGVDDDCDDGDATVNPDATEVCDEIDNNCDGSIDEGTADDAALWYADTDDDGYGDADASVASCEQPTGYVDDSTDCDDTDPNVNPGTMEVMDNSVDDDCDGTTDEDITLEDNDGDGFTPADGDCNDLDGAVNPDATEMCDDIDNDCDGSVDEAGAADVATWYRDEDGDTFGDATSSVASCDAPDGYVSSPADCDDDDEDVNPDATEVCDGVDNDCNGSVDGTDAADVVEWYRDADGDGYGDETTSATGCEAPSGYVANDSDCDDADVDVNPRADEVCDGVDNDCNGSVDDDAVDAMEYCLDSDGDGYGDGVSTILSCEVLSGYVDTCTDCDDSDPDIYPGTDTAEVAYNGIDDDCDGRIDEHVAADETGWTVIGTREDHQICDEGGILLSEDLNGDSDPELIIASINDSSVRTSAGAVSFHDAGTADYPADYDQGWLLVYGGGWGDRLGSAIALAGDPDGDGEDGVVVGARRADGERDTSGVVYIFDVDGLSGEEDVTDIEEGRIEGESEDGAFGSAASVGDMDGDGDPDLVVGAPDESSDRGRVYVYFADDDWGGDTGIAARDSSFYLHGVSDSDHLGAAVLLSEDLTGDGYGDLVACAPYYTRDDDGGCWLVEGGSGLSAEDEDISSWDEASFQGSDDDDNMGNGNGTLASGDFDDDGTPDLAIGVPGYDGAEWNGGAVWLYLGGSLSGSYDDGDTDLLVQGDGDMGLGISLDGDVDDDGAIDLLAGARDGGSGSKGIVYLIPSGSSGTLTVPGDESASWLGESGSDEFGRYIGGFLDLDGDGTGDFAAGATGNDDGGSSAGKVTVLPGN